MLQGALGDLLTVDERPVARAAIAKRVAPVLLHDLGVFARDIRADDLQSGGCTPPDEKQRTIENDDPSSLGITDVEARFAHPTLHQLGFERPDLHQRAGEVIDAALVDDESILEFIQRDDRDVEGTYLRGGAHEAAVIGG